MFDSHMNKDEMERILFLEISKTGYSIEEIAENLTLNVLKFMKKHV